MAVEVLADKCEICKKAGTSECGYDDEQRCFEAKGIDLSLLHPDMAMKLEVYRKVWAQYDGADIKEYCECLVSGCILDGDTCECAFHLFNTLEDCEAMHEREAVA